jgi:hypothetical protein
MRTYLRGKITLLFMMFGLLLAIPAVALADVIVADGDTGDAVTTPQQTVELGTVAPGATVTKNASFTLQCNSAQHIEVGETLSLLFSSSSDVFNSADNTVAASGSVSAVTTNTDPLKVAFPAIPSTWPLDGNNSCGTTPQTLNATDTASVTITAPTAPGTYFGTAQFNHSQSNEQPSDIAGNNTSIRYNFTVPSDTTAPTSTASATVPDGTGTSPYAGGTSWTNKDVTVTLNATDNAGGSGVKELTYSATGADPISPAVTKAAANLPTSFTIDAEGTTTISYFAKDNNNNVETAKTFVVNIDKVKPVISATATVPDGGDAGTDPDPYTAGTWTNKDVTVSFSCTDARSGTDTNTVAGDTKTASGADQSVTNTGTCTDKAGNTADSKTFNDIDIDKDAPTIASSADRLNDDNTVAGTYTAGTWTNKSVRVSFSCNDTLSGVNTTTSNIAGNTLTTEGENQSVSSTGSCVDQAGNTTSGASFTNIDIDKTAPTNIQFQFSGTPVLTNNQTYEFGSVPAGPTGCSANGDISGLKSPCSTDAASTYKTTVGNHTITATAEDNAGNIGHATLVYTVDPWDATGFYSPVGTDNSKFLPAPGTLPTVNNSGEWNTVKGGSTVPLKFNVYAGSTEKTSTDDIQYLKAQQMNCSSVTGGTVGDAVDFTTTEQTSLRYSGTPGVDGQFIQNWKTPKVSGETCYRTAVTLDDGSSIYAFFKLLK